MGWLDFRVLSKSFFKKDKYCRAVSMRDTANTLAETTAIQPYILATTGVAYWFDVSVGSV